uniref:Uncharacterized protein n=1 Tax=viral metagenome TaxID=1070528 RepID=A0A6C0B8S1_9ZZZZ
MITPYIAKKIILGIISPHGSTDLIHATQNGLVPKLLQIQAANMAGFQLLTQLHQDKIVDILFLLMSLVHFRHDIISLKQLSTNFWILALFTLPEIVFHWVLFGIPSLNASDLFLLYMTFLHVPNHYYMSWNFIKKQKGETAFLLGLFTMLFLYFGEALNFSNMNIQVLALVKSFVVSHVVYNEKYVYKNRSMIPGIIKYM